MDYTNDLVNIHGSLVTLTAHLPNTDPLVIEVNKMRDVLEEMMKNEEKSILTELDSVL